MAEVKVPQKEPQKANKEKASESKSSGTTDALENFDPNVIAVFSYLLPPVTGIIFFLVEKKDKFVRFHAFQSILFGAALFVLWKVAQLLKIILIGHVLEPVVSIGGFVFWLLLMWKAYNKEKYELPYLGKMAKDQVNK